MLPDRIDDEYVPVWDQPTWPRVWQSGLSVVGAAAVGIACFFGGGDLVTTGGGASTMPISYYAPTTPTHDAVVFASTGDSLRILGSAFQGNPDTDTHDSTQIAVDTAGAAIDADSGFVTPRYFASLGAVLTDTVPALDSGGVFVSRIRYKGAGGGWSAWSDSLSTTMTAHVVLFQCDWDDLGDRTQVQSCGAGSSYSWDIFDAVNDTALQVVDATDNGLSVNWPNDRAYLVRCQDRGGNGCARQVIRSDTVFALPVAGDTLSFRFSRTVSSDVMKGTGDMNEHGFKWPTGGSLAETQASNHAQVDVSASQWSSTSQMQAGAPSTQASKWCPMAAGDTGGCNQGPRQYHFEADHGYEIHYLYSFPTDTSYILEGIRVYDIPGDSLISGITWQNTNGSDSLPSPEIVADTTSVRGWNWHTMTLGHSANGEFSFQGTGERLFYFGGFAVCKNTWCPRYGGLPGEN